MCNWSHSLPSPRSVGNGGVACESALTLSPFLPPGLFALVVSVRTVPIFLPSPGCLCIGGAACEWGLEGGGKDMFLSSFLYVPCQLPRAKLGCPSFIPPPGIWVEKECVETKKVTSPKTNKQTKFLNKKKRQNSPRITIGYGGPLRESVGKKGLQSKVSSHIWPLLFYLWSEMLFHNGLRLLADSEVGYKAH